MNGADLEFLFTLLFLVAIVVGVYRLIRYAVRKELEAQERRKG